jgi:hypothetical protein
MGRSRIKSFEITWKREEITELEGSRFVFTLNAFPYKSVQVTFDFWLAIFLPKNFFYTADFILEL